MSSELYCNRSYSQVLGCVLNNPNLLYDLDKPLEQEDFDTDDFHKLIFTVLYNLYFVQNCEVIDEMTVDAYLSPYQEQYNIFKNNNGLEYVHNIKELANLETYDYYYHRMKKYSLLRYYEKKGLDIKWIYDYTVSDPVLADRERQKFDELTEDSIVGMIESEFVLNPKNKFCAGFGSVGCQAGKGMKQLINSFIEIPDIGMPFNSPFFTTVGRGARLGCFYLRSAGSGGSKTRQAVADAVTMAVPWLYDLKQKIWIHTGFSEPTLLITTEMKVDEIQTIMAAFIAGIDEEKILSGTCTKKELERLMQASEYIEQAPLYIEHLPNFDIDDIKNVVKKYHRERLVNYFFYDYIHTSLKLMGQISKQSGMRLQEHQMLLAFSTELKDLCQQLNIFMLSSTQLSGDYENARYKDQQLLAGAKSLANKLDLGVICMKPNEAEKKKIAKITRNMICCPEINMLTWVYKLRRGKLSRIIIFSHYDIGTMRCQDLFVTNFDFELIDIDVLNIDPVKLEHILHKHSVTLTAEDIEKDEQIFMSENEVDITTGEIIWKEDEQSVVQNLERDSAGKLVF